MRTSAVALPIDAPIEKLAAPVRVDPLGGPQRLYPVVGEDGRLEGVVTRFELHQLAERAAVDPAAHLARGSAGRAGPEPRGGTPARAGPARAPGGAVHAAPGGVSSACQRLARLRRVR
jgi:hypothetical protein